MYFENIYFIRRMSTNAKPFIHIFIFVHLIGTMPVHGTLNTTNEVRMFKGLPLGTVDSLVPRTLTIRHDLPGKVVFNIGSVISIEANITYIDSMNTSQIQTNYKIAPDNHSIVLEVYKLESPETFQNPPKDQILLIVATSVSGFVVICILVSLVLYFCWWKKKTRTMLLNEDFEDSQLIKAAIPRTFSQKRRLYDASSNHSTLHITLVVVIAAVCVSHAQLYLVTVDLVITVPEGFLKPDSRIFFNEDNNNQVDTLQYKNDSILVFDVENASPAPKDMCILLKAKCNTGTCDSLTGLCVCPRGKKMIQGGGGKARCVFECTQPCPSGTYEFSPCNQTHPAVCKACRPACSFKEFESTACVGNTDRNCTIISLLPRIKVSSNVIYEDLSKVDSDTTVDQLIINHSAQYNIWLNRSSGVSLKVRIVSADFSTTYRQVDHPNNDNDMLPSKDQTSKTLILDTFCKTPVPDYYKIQMEEYQNLDVVKEDHSKICPNYTREGVHSFKPTQGRDLYCTGVNNSMVEIFGNRISSHLSWKEEKERDCYISKIKCGECRDNCSKGVFKIPECNIKKENANFGEHFSYCFDCCFDGCTCPSCFCGKYERNCVREQLTCVRVKQYKLSLEPTFPAGGNFSCHVEASRGPEISIETSLWRYGNRVYASTTNSYNLTKQSTKQTVHDFGYMTVRHPPILQSMHGENILVSGNVRKKKFNVGVFFNEDDVTNTVAMGAKRTNIHIQPRVPFAINSKTWPKRNCNDKSSINLVVVKDQLRHTNFKKLENLTAEIDQQGKDLRYKIHDNKLTRKLSFEVSQNRSILRNIFPKTAIVNDRTLVGDLYRNRTFWTLRFTGRTKECPGAFNVRIYDQDMPNVEVYNYDIAVTRMNCKFLLEFYLPSGGDTNLIDKQFLIKFTDSYKKIQLALVSPRYAPNFNLRILENKPDINHILKVLLPAIYALGAALVLLFCLLVFGYKTRPKDKMHRDRDSKLHFRHILFVVWFVGMRLIKSFLLTFSLFFILLSAIHHSNINTLRRYPEFRDQRQRIDKDLMSIMDQHKVQEINRQLGLLNEGKEMCDKKLREADALIDTYFDEMRRRLMEDMKQKSVIYAAYKNMEKKVKSAKKQFDNKREDFNRALRTATNEINYRIQSLRGKIESNFWLGAAKVMHRFINSAAKLFGHKLEPFMNWVDLDVSFPSISFSLGSFDVYFDDFATKFKKPDLGFSLKFNASRWQGSFPTPDLSLNLKEFRLPPLNISSPVSSRRVKELLALDWIVALLRSGVLAGILLALDVTWFVYRHSRTYQSAVVLLHGFPVVYELKDVKKEKEKLLKKASIDDLSNYGTLRSEAEMSQASSENSENSLRIKICKNKLHQYKQDEVQKSQESLNRINESKVNLDEEEEKQGDITGGYHDNEVTVSSQMPKYGMMVINYLNGGLFFVYGILKKINYEVTKTNLVPLAVLGVMGLLLIYVVIVTAKYTLTVDTLDEVGYFNIKMAPILVTRKIVNTRITSGAFMINQIQIPYYQNRVNARIAFAKKKAAFFKGFQCTTADLHNKEYCFWVDGQCDGVKSYTDDFLKNLTRLECHVPSVIPRRFTKFDRFIYKQQLKKGYQPFVTATRGLILNTFYTALIILGIFVFVKLLGLLVFLALRRLDLIRTVKNYKLAENLGHEETQEDEIDGKLKKTGDSIGRLKVPDVIVKTCGPTRGRPGWHLEYRPDKAAELRSKKREMKARNDGESI